MKKIVLLMAVIAPSYIHTMEQAPRMEPKKNYPDKHFVFHPHYDISLLGLEKLHPFDTCKYGKVADALMQRNVITTQNLHKPKEISDTDLKLVHKPEHIDDLRHNPSKIFSQASGADVNGTPINWVPNFLTDWIALYPMRLATGGTVDATKIALENGWAVNLSGGYHHAKSNDCFSGGFCVYNDAGVAAFKAIKDHNIKKILVVDLDAHQGNGNEEMFAQSCFEGKVVVFDMYGRDIFPTEERALIANQPDWYNIALTKEQTSDEAYLSILKTQLAEAIKKTNPDLIIYNAGTDIYEKDPLGKMLTSADGIITRDKHVFQTAKNNNIPIVMLPSGGYTQESAQIITNSIQEIFLLMKNLTTVPKKNLTLMARILNINLRKMIMSTIIIVTGTMAIRKMFYA